MLASEEVFFHIFLKIKTKEYLQMKVIKYGRWVLALVLPLVGSVGNAALVSASTVYPYSASGIVAPSWPLFLDKNETIKIEKQGDGSNTYWKLTGNGTTTSLYGSQSNYVNLGNDTVKY
jgi:hypothetical protein